MPRQTQAASTCELPLPSPGGTSSRALPVVREHTAHSGVASAAARAVPLGTLLTLSVSALWCVAWFVHALGYWEDDAWIHLEFARSVARGQGFAFNGHVVYGDTSPLWVWLLDLFHSAIPSWVAAGKTLSAVAAVFALGGMFAFARSLAARGARPLPPARASQFAAATVLLTVTNPYFGYWAFSGMEALAAAGLVCWACVAVAPRVLTPARFLLAAAAGGLAPLLRPEMGFFTVLLGLLLLERLQAVGRSRGSRAALLGAGLLLIAAPGVLWGAYALHHFGHILPNTNAAKRTGPADSVPLRLLHIYGFGFPLIVLGLLVGAGSLGRLWLSGRRRPLEESRESGPWTWLPAGGWLLLVWTGINGVFYVVNHTYVQTRYIFVTAPVLTIVLMALAAKTSPRLYRAGLTFGVLFGLTVSGLATWPLIANKIVLDQRYAQLAAYLHSLPPDAPVAHYSIGQAAFQSEHPIIDTGGITRPGAIPFLWDTDDHRLVQWIHTQGALYDVVDHQPEPGATMVWHTTVPTTGWFLDPRRYRGTERLEVWRLNARR